jgi:putative salt-induced outer membrane protein YdiY
MIPREKIRTVCHLFLFFLLAALPARAASWMLANGDRLTGTLVRETEAELEIRHDQLGTLKIPRSALAPAPSAPTAAALAKVPTTPDTAPAGKSDKVIPKWTRQLELGYSTQEGAKTKRDLTARFSIEGRDKKSNSYRATATAQRSEAQGIITADRQQADFRWRHDFSKRLFTQSLSTYSSDDLKQINYSVEQQLGGGYKILDGPKQQVNVGLGAVVQRLSRDGYEDYTALLGSAFQDYSLQWDKRFKFTQEATVFLADSPNMSARGGRSTVVGAPTDGNYRIKFNAALQSRMTERISLNLRYELDYDHSVPDPNFRSDSRLTSSLGYAW